MKDKKRVLSKYSFYDRTHIQQYLEDMASKGWMLEKITSFYWQFKAIEPQTLHFSINYFPPASEFDAEPSEQLLTIRDYCAHAGWEFVTASAQMQIYCNAQENPTPIETDALVEVETIHKAMKKNFLPSQIVLLILGILQMILHVNMFRINPIGYFTNASNFVATFCWLVVIAMCSLEVFGYLRWYKKARHAAEVDGTCFPAETFGNLFFLNPAGQGSGIHICHFGGENDICAMLFAKDAVVFKISGIAVEIFIRPELSRVDENGNGDNIRAFGVSRINEGEVTVMEESHSGNQSDGLTLAFLFH